MAFHHPENSMLFDYATGSLEEEPSLVIAAHLTFCNLCLEEVRSLEHLGGMILSDAAGEELTPDALASVMARIDSPDQSHDAQQTVPSDPVLPGPVARYLGTGLDGLHWQRIAQNVEEARIATTNATFKTCLLRIKKGTAIPMHTHGGTEYTLVLKGAIVDDEKHYLRGDLMLADGMHEHRPVAAGNEECICLAVLDAPLRFTSFFGRLLNPFFSGSFSR